MRWRGKGINIQALTECVCYLLFGGLLFGLTYSGEYLNYVTPRMKPYLYGLSALMFLWTAVAGRHLLTPRHRAKLSRAFVYIIPAVLLAIHPPAMASSMAGSFDGFAALSAADSSGTAGRAAQQAETMPQQEANPQPESQPETRTGTGQGAQPEPEAQTQPEPESAAETYAEDDRPWYDLNGLDEASKTITIADEDYYIWMYELGNYYEKYEGYTVVMKGFVYRDPEIEKQCSFALVRLSMWCCAADLSPMGFLVYADQTEDLKNDEWVRVTGTLGLTDDGSSITLTAQKVEPAEKPEEEYIYPYF